MNNVSQLEVLAENDLDQVIGGGLDYHTAKAVQDAYLAAEKVTKAVGLPTAASWFNGAAYAVGQTLNGPPA